MEKTDEGVTVEIAKKLGLSAAEFERIQEILHRPPNFAELRIFSVMWSDAYSYKNALYWLDTLPRKGERALPGNNFLIDIGDDLVCTFKIKSYSPGPVIDQDQISSAGLNGIVSEILAIGAQPLVNLNSFHFGNYNLESTKQLVQKERSRIPDIGNGMIVPTFGSGVYFNDCYNENILVNTLAVGVANADKLLPAMADGPGNPVFLVEMGNFFNEKQIQEVLKTGAITGMQYMGAAGIICSASEMSAKGGVGMRLELDKIPLSQNNSDASEILLSDRPHQMMVVGLKGKEELLLKIFKKENLNGIQIGEVTDTGYLEYYQKEELVAHVPAFHLVMGEGAPVYQRDFGKPAYLKKSKKFRLSKLAKPKDYLAAAKKLFSAPNIISKSWISAQSNGSLPTTAPSDAAVVQVEGTQKTLAVTTACNPTYVYTDPFIGTMINVAEAARKIVCSGAKPVAIAHCLNFGDPYDKEVYWQFIHAIKGIGEVARKFKISVTADTVSFYNQSISEDRPKPIYPSPVIGILGILEEGKDPITIDFKKEGDQIYMLGTPHNDLGSSEYLRVVCGIDQSLPPRFDLDEERQIQRSLKTLIRKGIIRSAHDVSEGGLFVSLMESAMVNHLGFEIETDTNFRKDAYLFGESQSRIVISLDTADENKLIRFLNSNNLPFTHLGEVKGHHAIIDKKDFGPIETWKTVYNNKLAEKLATKETE